MSSPTAVPRRPSTATETIASQLGTLLGPWAMPNGRIATAPQSAALRTKIAGEIREVLRPEQMAAFDRFLKKQEERALEER